MQNRVELIRKLGMKVMALTFRSGLINHSNRSLQAWFAQQGRGLRPRSLSSSRNFDIPVL